MKIQKLFSLDSEFSDKITCFYTNTTSQVQIVRITNIANWKFERVIFPGERLLFEPAPDAELEVYTSLMHREVLVEKIACDRLRVDEISRVFELEKQADLSYICL